MNFELAFNRIIGTEGGYSNDPKDPGGETNWGISKRSYPNVDIRNLTRDGAKAIYLPDFWIAGRMDQLDGPLAFQVFDAAVNHGIRRALKLLQAAAGVTQDGTIGQITLAAINTKRRTAVLALFIAARLEFWTDLPGWGNYGRGWAKRAVTDIRYAVTDYDIEENS